MTKETITTVKTEGNNPVFKLIEQKGSFRLGLYESGFYAVEFNNKSVGLTLLFTKDKTEAQRYFNQIDKNDKKVVSGKCFSCTCCSLVTASFNNITSLPEKEQYYQCIADVESDCLVGENHSGIYIILSAD